MKLRRQGGCTCYYPFSLFYIDICQMFYFFLTHSTKLSHSHTVFQTISSYHVLLHQVHQVVFNLNCANY